MDKSGTYSVLTKMRNFTLGDESLRVTDVVKTLGVHIAAGPAQLDLDLARLGAAKDIAARIRFAPLPFHARVQLMESVVLPRGLYECTVAPLSRREIQKFSTVVLRGLLGVARGRMCAEIVFTLFGRGHRTDAPSPHGPEED